MRFFASSAFSFRPVIFDNDNRYLVQYEVERTMLYLDSGLLVNGFLLLATFLLFFLNKVIRNVHLYAELVTEFIDTGTM